MKRLSSLLLRFVLLPLLLVAVAGLTWLRWDAHRPLDTWWDERHGRLAAVSSERGRTPGGQLSEAFTLVSTSGLQVRMRVIRPESVEQTLPVLIVLGGHRTGQDAVDLFGHVGERAIIGVDYPYDGPEKVRGVRQTLATMPLARQAFRDTVPAVSLVLDWVEQQPWVDGRRVFVVGASLGVPFATTAAARDTRIRGAILVHGAADNRLWLEAQLERRIDTGFLHYPLATVLHWVAYGPAMDTRERVAAIAPRPVVIIGARNDERTPAGQTQLLYDLAGEPKRLRYTDGMHIEPDRPEIIEALLRIADEEMAFLTNPP